MLTNESMDTLRIDPLSSFGTPVEIVALFDGKDGYLAALHDLEKALYESAA